MEQVNILSHFMVYWWLNFNACIPKSKCHLIVGFVLLSKMLESTYSMLGLALNGCFSLTFKLATVQVSAHKSIVRSESRELFSMGCSSAASVLSEVIIFNIDDLKQVLNSCWDIISQKLIHGVIE